MPDIFNTGSIINKPDVPQITTNPDVPRGKMNFLTNFRLFPDGISVENQQPDETIVLFLRRDFSTNIPWIIISVVLLLLPILLSTLPLHFFPFVPGKYVILLVLFYYIIIIGFIIVNFTNWFYNISLVTNERVIDIEYSNITYKHVSATTIQNVKDISYVQTGFLQSFFDFGNVRIETAGEIPEFLFEYVPRPATVEDIILELIRGIKND